MRRRIGPIGLQAALALLLASCSDPEEPSRTALGDPGPAAESGTISVFYEETADYALLASSLAGSGIFEAMAESVTSVVALPQDLEAVFTECGQANAFYGDGQIVMCYEFFDLFVGIFMQYSNDPETIQRQVFGTGAFFYLHEIGHALVDQLQLPITAREEDSVDTLATFILLLGGSESELLAAVQNFAFMAAVAESEGFRPYWDEHSLDAQRQYDIACLIYGSDPEGWDHLVAPDLLPEERAVRCPREFVQKSLGWDQLLAPYYRQ